MPRPKQGYSNAAGQPIPGTHDPINRFLDATALKFWAWKQGKAGISLFDRTALDIGTAVHTMIELDLKGRPQKDIAFYAEQTLKDGDDLGKAIAAFKAWRAWSDKNALKPVAQEIPLISEKHQFGGTPDLIATMGNGLGLIDFKTSAKGDVYPDKLVALAAHGKLWTENHPNQPLTAGYHLIMLAKDGSGFRHYAYADLKPHWKLFKIYLKAYHLDKLCSDKKVLAGGKIETSKTAVTAPPIAATEPATSSPTKPRVRIKGPSSASPLTMAELLRSYGHVQEMVA